MHGLDAQSPATWIAWKQADDPYSGDVHWLRDNHMLPHFIPNSRILTYDWNASYDKNASSDRFIGYADTLLDRLYVEREQKALLRAADEFHPGREKYRPILDCTIGVTFLGTPFQGSWGTGYTAADMRIAAAIESEGEYTQELIQYLRRGSPDCPGPLDSLVQRFCEMIRHKNSKFGVVCFYETRHTNFSAKIKRLPKDYAKKLDANGHGIVVMEDSACLQGVTRIPLDVRHNMLHKFNSPDNDGFQRLVSTLKEFMKGVESITCNRSISTTPNPEGHQRHTDIITFRGQNSGLQAGTISGGLHGVTFGRN
ncbi:hypothetical protein QQS21_001743 [Conoideocrella luteorostrata]|uniref:Uncharacterized protein n=1 Tax=Conoideocrella luteorostrata TaxID=1105319 RepID=A0AAJ0CWK5_9HYPO|nr:hypothetical protein QQS21_001743 [Conoideocrella luteorostrata]